jgi:acyl-CoA thioester hydrolase
MAGFNYEMAVDVRFRDVDAMGHVNNAVYSTYMEQARIEYLEHVVGEGIFGDVGVVIADLHVDFARPIDYGESVVVGVRAGELGASSIPVEHEIRADGVVAATAEGVLVTYDSEAEEAIPVPDEWRDRIRAHEGR